MGKQVRCIVPCIRSIRITSTSRGGPTTSPSMAFVNTLASVGMACELSSKPSRRAQGASSDGELTYSSCPIPDHLLPLQQYCPLASPRNTTMRCEYALHCCRSAATPQAGLLSSTSTSTSTSFASATPLASPWTSVAFSSSPTSSGYSFGLGRSSRWLS